MTIVRRGSTFALAVALSWPVPVAAQNAGDVAAMRAEIQAMREQVAALEAKVDSLESQLETTTATTPATPAAVPTPPKPADDGVKVAWKGAPEITGKDGFSFKPRGRVQVDLAGVDAPDAIAGNSLGVATEFRRVYLGVDGTLPGGFGYRAEADLANSSVDLTDVYLTYKAGKSLTLTAGQHKALWGLEELTSDLFTSFMERAAFNSAFGFERRVGLSATWSDGPLLVQGGVFADNAADLNNDSNNSYSVDGRAVLMPKLAGGQLHIGGSAHFRDFNDAQTTTRYRARPFTHTTDLRLVDTRAFSAAGERSFGAEAAYILGRFHATAEGHWITARRPGLADPTFFGGYAELGYLLTDDQTGYKGGVYDRIRPKRPLGQGGLGALQLNARYDYLDLNDSGIVGGRQQVAGLSLVWIPTDYVRFVVNYGHLWIDDAAVPAGLDRDYSADTVGVRAQVDF